jgi:hypothetical protein
MPVLLVNARVHSELEMGTRLFSAEAEPEFGDGLEANDQKRG